ncbi:exported hypothetical protein [Tenacibaculum litopenaei]
MRRMRNWCVLVCYCLITTASFAQRNLKFLTSDPLHPKGLAYCDKEAAFLVSSLTRGEIGLVDWKGTYRTFLKHPSFYAITALKVQNGKLYVTVGDLEPVAKTPKKGVQRLARLMVFNIATKELLRHYDLESYYHGPHRLHDMAIDSSGNIYVTDAKSPVIYKIPVGGSPFVFVRLPKRLSFGKGLKGIVFHPNGYLLAANSTAGTLIKISLVSRKIKEVKLSSTLLGADGLLLSASGRLYLGQNTSGRGVHELISTDDFASAYIKASEQQGINFVTAVTEVAGTIYFLNVPTRELEGDNPKDHKYEIKAFKAVYPDQNLIQKYAWSALKTEVFGEKISRKVVPSNAGTLAIYHLKKGAHIPKHSHPQEQITYIRKGLVKIVVGGKEKLLSSGEFLVIPPNVHHEFFVLEDTEDIDVFAPCREKEWILGTVKFLNNQNK